MNILTTLNNILWIIISILLITIGLYFTYKLHGKQFKFKKIIRAITQNNPNQKISSYSTLMLSLAGRIGVGSIAGIALAIYLAGPGTIFWIWSISLISAILAYVESYLGIKYHEPGPNNYYGGPAYYLKKALNKPKLGALYSILIIICYCGGFMLIQANTITKSITEITNNISPITIGIILGILTCLIIFGGIKKISTTINKLVPIMSISYLSITIFIILTNLKIIPQILNEIFFHAFNYKSFSTGFITTMLIGIRRGIFSTEAGIGTGSIASAINDSNNAENQGFVQIISIYITSFLISTSTAIIILTSNYQFISINDPNGIELALTAFTYHLNSFGNIFLIIAIFLFAFSTILSGYFYGEISLQYLIKNNKLAISFLKIFVCIIIFLGTIISSSILWIIIDIFVSILALINIYAIIKLKNEV